MAEARTTSALTDLSVADPSKSKQFRRNIPGDFSYTSTHGKLRTALDNIVKAERPETFNKDFLSAYLGVSGGSATAIPPILKRMGFVTSDGKPTDLYAKFQNDNTRPAAALEGLRRAFSELFKRHTYAHTLSEEDVKNLLVEITGLKKSDAVLNNIYGTFDALRQFVPNTFLGAPEVSSVGSVEDASDKPKDNQFNSFDNVDSRFGLSYHINIVLPETKDIAVFNAIFQSLKQNLLS